MTAGESHGPKVVAIVEGLPAGLSIDEAAVQHELARRQRGYGRGQRMRSIEHDEPRFTAGLRFGETFGAPVLVEIDNADHAKWTGTMSPTNATPGWVARRSATRAGGVSDPSAIEKIGI